MGSRAWCWLWLFAACAPAPVEHAPSMFFGDVALGESRQVALTLTNHAAQSQPLTFEVLEGDFTLEESARTLAPHETSTVLVRFTPGDLGPRTGRLAINGVELSLAGRGTGARFASPSQLFPGRFALVSGQAEKVERAVLLVRNTGTAGSSLRLGTPRVDGTELCVGELTGGRCVPWEPPAGLDTETVLQVPLSFLVTTPGSRRWELVFPSNDFLHPEVTVEVLAFVEAVEPCRFGAVAPVVLATEPGVLQLTHAGPGVCVIRELTVSPPDALELRAVPLLPLHLQPGESFSMAIALRPLAPLQLDGLVHVEADATPPLDVPVRRELAPSGCLVISPAILDFGTVAQGCNSAERHVQLYNVCPSPLTLRSAALFATGDEPAGTPGCPGPLSCQEFFVVPPPANTVLNPGSTPVSFTVRYRPAGFGADNGAVRVETVEGEAGLLSLQGLAAPPPLNVDTFRQDVLPKADVLVMVDSSASFVTKRAGVRANLQSLLNHASACTDQRWAFAAADGAPDAGVELQLNDAGARWTSTLEPDFVDRALAAFDAVPVGSETEACIGPAADLVLDAGLRTGSAFSGLCVTDALEQSANPAAALQALQARSSTVTWSTVTGIETSLCAVEARDDGVHQGLVTAANGVRADLCDPDWWTRFVLGSSCSALRTRFFLTSPPAGPLELAIDGQAVPAADWFFDQPANAVVFLLGRQPAPGQTLTVRYQTTCTP